MMAALRLNLQTSRHFVSWPLAFVYTAIVVASFPIWPFGWHLALHILGATLLIGNALVMAAWLTVAGFSRSDAAKRRAARVVNLGDAWFTAPGVMLLLLNGLAMLAVRYGGPAAFATTGWITAGLVLLTLTGIIWAFRLVPAQLTLYRLAQVDGPLDVQAFRGVLNHWSLWGVIATALPLLAVFLMTTKPTI
jgi:uncharacterized membrane protein